MSNTAPENLSPIRIAGIEIPVAEQTPLVLALAAVIQRQERELEALRDEIQRLKGTTRRPKINPSRLLKPPPPPNPRPNPPGKRPGSEKRSKTRELKIDETIVLEPDGLPPDARLVGYRYAELGLVSDDAPPFKVFGFIHGLCWVHGERKIDRLIRLTARHRQAKETAQTTFWEIYESLKQYGPQPTPEQRSSIEQRFEQLCLGKTGYPDLNDALGLLHAKRDEFLAVLEFPHLPLHNNLAENDIREYARLRKISAGTRSDLGRRCRDTFLSLKKTCRKLGVSFCEYLRDRLTGAAVIPRLTKLMRQAASPPPELPPPLAPQSG